jgi:hypothetical protein
MNTTKIPDQFSSLTDHVKEYIGLKLELFRLTATEKLASLTTHILLSLILFVLGMFFLLFLSLAFIFWYGEVAGPMYEAALMVAGFYVVIALVIWIFRIPVFVNPLISRLSNLFLEEGTDETK